MHCHINVINPVLHSSDAMASSMQPTMASIPGNAGGGKVASGMSRGKKQVMKSKKVVELEAERMEIESKDNAGNADKEKKGGGGSGGTGKGKGKVQGEGKGK